jgi:putative transposase
MGVFLFWLPYGAPPLVFLIGLGYSQSSKQPSPDILSTASTARKKGVSCAHMGSPLAPWRFGIVFLRFVSLRSSFVQYSRQRSSPTYLHSMNPRPKTCYHPYLLVAFHLHCLPADLITLIPRSTQYDWSHKDQAALFGYEWYFQNRYLFNTLQEVAGNRRLLQVNRAFIRIIALNRFISRNTHRVRENIVQINKVLLNNVLKIGHVFGIKTTLKCLQKPYSWYLQIRRKGTCHSSPFSLCRIKHPTQLLVGEINIIKSYCSDPRFLHWPLSSLYHLIRRDHVAAFNISTFYKYASLLALKRYFPVKRRKNHDTGIRASQPLQILHADATVFRTADNSKSYIYLIQDNFSRAILSFRVALHCTARMAFENLAAVYSQYLAGSTQPDCQLITDDGSENTGQVKDFIHSTRQPVLRHVVAQRDIVFSNSMIEAANKQIKYRFLYHHHITDHAALLKYVQAAVEDYNNRPHDVLNGLTPLEVLNGKRFDQTLTRQEIAIARQTRAIENKKARCCYYTF